ncbi:MAG: hypothetical protein A2X05_11090 [Bacteroidetes bacterium GWE2_41_25]|nr:MAG: hypothetical protein A2X03_13855 [Bacteroidetes bacterium GWA2_40_15]OFX88917.1 MAG: hypothetical protein A2X06_10400 [Bacteroidetes bacterium GWC2_40_22]OFX96051.1 MAG: hypothetical protein A2X05_11090 [Bacteroidetes bacterium GWE2_41_25]OFY58385.1 MAG: hypothetical protein A2X04_12020 [Bacteroidetes bacterium GWF2_41_9]HBH85175.1 hypothetical protein [Bacteroidales bacterium]
MRLEKKKIIKTGIILLSGGLLLLLIIAGIVIIRTWGRTLIQIDIHQNKKIIHLSNFAEPPQFAIWLENPATNELKTVFVTHRVAKGDWEGKANVPVALPQWFKLFRDNKKQGTGKVPEKKSDLAISGATPKGDYFSIRVEVEPGSEWICWIEMNLAGDFNDAFPEIDIKTLREDEYSNGQPALIFRSELKAIEGQIFKPEIVSQSTWNKGTVTVEPVSDGVTNAKNVFDDIQISIIKPKPKLIDKTKVQDM